MPPPDDELPGPLAEVCVGVGHACARMDDGGVYCWGRNDDGAVGDGTLGGFRAEPVRVEGLPPARRLECTTRHSACALTDAGDVYCWGAGDAVAVTDAVDAPWPAPVRMDRLERGATDLLVSGSYACALYDSRAVCWGEWAGEPYLNRGFELGRVIRSIPRQVGACAELEDGRLVDLFAAHSFRPGLRELGAGVSDFACSTANGTSLGEAQWDVCRSLEPGRYECACNACARFEHAPLYDGFERVSIGSFYACGLRADGTVACRADDDRFEDAIPGSSRAWVDVAEIGEPSVHVIAGDTTACAITRSGALWCWTYDTFTPATGAIREIRFPR